MFNWIKRLFNKPPKAQIQHVSPGGVGIQAGANISGIAIISPLDGKNTQPILKGSITVVGKSLGGSPYIAWPKAIGKIKHYEYRLANVDEDITIVKWDPIPCESNEKFWLMGVYLYLPARIEVRAVGKNGEPSNTLSIIYGDKKNNKKKLEEIGQRLQTAQEDSIRRFHIVPNNPEQHLDKMLKNIKEQSTMGIASPKMQKAANDKSSASALYDEEYRRRKTQQEEEARQKRLRDEENERRRKRERDAEDERRRNSYTSPPTDYYSPSLSDYSSYDNSSSSSYSSPSSSDSYSGGGGSFDGGGSSSNWD